VWSGTTVRLPKLFDFNGPADDWLAFIVKSRQLIDIQPCLNKDVNMTLVAVPGAESRSVTHRDWRTLLRNSANNMLTRRPYDVPRANFADNPVGFRRLAICVLASRAVQLEPLLHCYPATGLRRARVQRQRFNIRLRPDEKPRFNDKIYKLKTVCGISFQARTTAALRPPAALAFLAA
jgi:hypothetical protein